MPRASEGQLDRFTCYELAVDVDHHYRERKGLACLAVGLVELEADVVPEEVDA